MALYFVDSSFWLFSLDWLNFLCSVDEVFQVASTKNTVSMLVLSSRKVLQCTVSSVMAIAA